MYIYTPGAGCIGDAKLVKPGDELIFSNSTQWEQREAPLLSDVLVKHEEAIASSCSAANTSEPPSQPFSAPLPKEDLNELMHKNFASETMKKIQWATKRHHEWREYHHSLGLEYIDCNLDDRATITATSLDFALCRFITEVKKVDGSDFPGKTLYDIIICLQFHLECLGFSFRLINDAIFRDIKFTVDNTMKQRVSKGIGLSVRQAQVLSITDEDYLWSMGYLGTSNPDQLLNTIVFCVGKGFALRAGKEHRALSPILFASQLKFMRDCDNEIFLRYTEDIGLNTKKGGLKHKKVNVKTVDMFASNRPEHCPLRIIVKYLSLLQGVKFLLFPPFSGFPPFLLFGKNVLLVLLFRALPIKFTFWGQFLDP